MALRTSNRICGWSRAGRFTGSVRPAQIRNLPIMSDNARKSTLTHLPTGKFAPGNPGRPKGSRNKVSNAALQAVKGMSDDAITQLKSRLDAGDWQAITFVLERILPRGRLIELDGISPEDVMSQMLSGEVTTLEAKEISAALKNLNEINDLKEVKEKLAFLERILSGKG